MKFKYAGFTLIEVIAVIVVLGIIAAIAIPRFLELSREARVANLNGLFGSVRSASTMAHTQAAAQGVTNGSITLEGIVIGITNSYPSASGIKNAVSHSGFVGFSPSGSPTVTFSVADSAGAAIPNCNFTYTIAPANGEPTISALNTSGC